MQKEIKTISLSLPFRVGSVNCYLIATDAGYVLIDTGGSNSRQRLVSELERAGCKPGLLKLILLTHGDFDHTGNAAYLRTALGGEIAMHAADSGMVARGDMLVNRKKPNLIIRMLLPIFSGFGRLERFAPDLLVADGDDLSAYGFDASVISLPGHSKGSIGILTAGGELFCGDLLVNTDKPVLNSLTDDLAAANASLQKLGSMSIGAVYPGHGGPFPIEVVSRS
ncbi:MAG TPA: MBL fold metallo-hydrolase [Anaerolineales bacterium]|nr:MBL fold metallo-hydrolase [Anaerolineales bacterium]